MKTMEEKLHFKTQFFKLGQGRLLDVHDEFWSIFWTSPSVANDIFEILTPFDIQTIRDQNRVNFLSLLYLLIRNVVQSSGTAPGTGTASKSQFDARLTLNSIRLLTKLLPFLYELSDYKDIEEDFFLGRGYNPMDFVVGQKEKEQKEQKEKEQKEQTGGVVAESLIKALIKLLYFKGFTMSQDKGSTDSMVYYSVWEPGIGIFAKYQVPDLIIESNRTTVIKLIITLCGVSFYHLPSQAVGNGSIFLTLLVASLPRVEILTLVCSLINVVCRASRPSADENMLQLSDPHLKFSRTLYVQNCMLLLTLMIVYPLPPKQNLQPLKKKGLIPEKCHNTARLYFGKLHKDQELLFLASSLLNSLKSVIGTNETDSNFNINLRAAAPPVWAMEAIMMLWELFQCNSKFKQVAGTKFHAEICFVLGFYIKQFHNNVNDKNMVRLACYFLLYLSHQEALTDELLTVNPEFSIHLPQSVTFHPQHQQISTRDYLIIQICGILSSNASAKQHQPSNSVLATTLVEILYNIVPLVSDSNTINGTNDASKKLYNTNPKGGLSYSACTALTNLIVRFSNREFLLKESFNSDLLALLIRSVCTASLRDGTASRTLLFSILKSEKIYDQTWNTIYSFKNEYFEDEMLVLKSIPDCEEEPKEVVAEPNSNVTTNANTPLNGSTTNLTINDEHDENDPKSPHQGYQSDRNQDHWKGSQGGSIASEEHLGLEDDPEDFDAETKAIEKALRPSPPTGMSSKARGKQKLEAPIYKTWGGNDALRIILTIIIPHLKLMLNEIWSSDTNTTVDAFELVRHIGESSLSDILSESKINFDFLPTSPLVPLKFTWSSLSLGWYISLLYCDIYNSIDSVDKATGGRNKIINNLTASVLSFGRFFQGPSTTLTTSLETPETISEIETSITKINPWAKTSIKLFKLKPQTNGFFDSLNSKLTSVQSQALPTTPNLNGDNLSRRLSGLRLNQIRTESVGSGLSTPIEEQEAFFPRIARGNSVSSFQSLNTMNRSRTNTPRNSISEHR